MRTAISALPIVFYLVALLLGLLKVDLPFASADLSPLAQWMLFLSLAVQSLWAAFAHVFYTETVARSIGWEPSLFQHEIGGQSRHRSWRYRCRGSWRPRGLGDVLRGSKLSVERRRRACRRYGPPEEFRHQQRFLLDLLVGRGLPH